MECDGATYHASATARDRDRLRQAVLEELGWRVCRIWSTDWLRDREGQVQRVLTALEAARRTTPADVASRRPEPTPPVPAVSGGPKPVAEALPYYAAIDDVPEAVIRDLVCRILREFGATEAEELVQATTRRLGFKRTGKRIQTRLDEVVEALTGAGLIGRAADQRLHLTQPDHAKSG